MTARARAKSPHAKAVERIVVRHTPVGPAFAGDRAMLSASILRLVARVEREALHTLSESCVVKLSKTHMGAAKPKKGARRK